MSSLVVPSDSIKTSCWIFKPPLEKQRLSTMPITRTNKMVEEFRCERSLPSLNQLGYWYDKQRTSLRDMDYSGNDLR